MLGKESPGPLMKQICSLPNLRAAWRAVRGNIPVRRRAYSRGVDEVSVAAFEQQWEANLEALSLSMLEGGYQPLPPRRIEIAKQGGGERTIGLLAVRDRIAQRAAHQVLEPLFDRQFLDCSYGFRSGRSVEDALHRVLCYRQAGCEWVFDADIANCFDTIDHRLLMRFVSETVSERAVLRLIESWLEVGVLETDAEVYRVPGRWERWFEELVGRLRGTPDLLLPSGGGMEGGFGDPPNWDDGWRRREMVRQVGLDALLAGLTMTKPALKRVLPRLRRLMRRKRVIWGTAGVTALATLVGAWWMLQRMAPRPRGALQGGAISPLLANVYLHHFDIPMREMDQNLVRFADDFVLCCPSREAAERARELSARELAGLRLRLNAGKSQIVSFRDGFRFLGHRFDKRFRLGDAK